MTIKYEMVCLGDSPSPDLVALSAQINVLNSDTELAKYNIKRLTDFIRLAQSSLDYENPDLKNQLFEYSAEKNNQEYEQVMEETASDQKVNVDQKTKDAWRRLSKLCHPDKTDDTELHELFLYAQNMYLSGDNQGIEELIKIAIQKKGSRNIVERIRTKFDRASQVNNAVNIQLATILQSPMMHISKVWYMDRHTATKMYREMLKSAMQPQKDMNETSRETTTN